MTEISDSGYSQPTAHSSIIPYSHILRIIAANNACMVQKNFGIYGDAAVAARLYLEISGRYIACWCISENGRQLHSFELFVFTEADATGFDELLRIVKLHSKLFEQSYIAVTIIWDSKASAVVPAVFYTDEIAADYLLMETGFSYTGKLLKDNAGSQVVTYHIPVEDLAVIKKYFPASKHVHKKSLLYKKYADTKEQPAIVRITFYNGSFDLLILKDGAIQLYQQYNYQTAEDVLYYILNGMQQTGANKETALVYLNGMLDKGSSLFKELNMYLNNLQPDNLAADKLNKELFAEYPLHYFSPFYNLVV